MNTLPSELSLRLRSTWEALAQGPSPICYAHWPQYVVVRIELFFPTFAAEGTRAHIATAAPGRHAIKMERITPSLTSHVVARLYSYQPSAQILVKHDPWLARLLCGCDHGLCHDFGDVPPRRHAIWEQHNDNLRSRQAVRILQYDQICVAYSTCMATLFLHEELDTNGGDLHTLR